MLVPIGKRYTSTATKSATKTVTCENCHKNFEYDTTRTAQGFGDSLLWLDNKGAEERASRFANKNCEKMLRKAIEITPCPHCGWYQRNMVMLGKRKRLLYTALLGLPASIIASIWQSSRAATAPSDSWQELLPFISFCTFVFLGIVWFFRYNPNRS